jgi:hypothetical protein
MSGFRYKNCDVVKRKWNTKSILKQGEDSKKQRDKLYEMFTEENRKKEAK